MVQNLEGGDIKVIIAPRLASWMSFRNPIPYNWYEHTHVVGKASGDFVSVVTRLSSDRPLA